MGAAEPFDENDSLEKKFKCLPDEDLLEIWAESQALENMLNRQAPGHDFPGSSFEEAIVHELALRTSQRLSTKRP